VGREANGISLSFVARMVRLRAHTKRHGRLFYIARDQGNGNYCREYEKFEKQWGLRMWAHIFSGEESHV